MTDRRSPQRGTYEWPNDNWGWIAAALVGVFMLGGVAVENYGGHSRAASFLEDATTGQSTRPPANAVAPALPAPRPVN
jgi:hypothetical protein